MRRMGFSAGIVACLLLAACRGGGDDGGGGTTPPPPPPPPPVDTGIGSAGGTVSEPSGAKVIIPAGALSTSTAIAVAKVTAGAPALPAGVTAFGPIYAFTPHGTAFSKPATITIPYDPAGVPAGTSPTLYKTDATLTNWSVVPGAFVSGNAMVGDVTGFSDTVVGSAPPPALEKGNPLRDIDVITNPLDHSPGKVIDHKPINVGPVDLNYDFGPAHMIDPFGPLPEILPLHPRATGRIFSSPGGASYGVSGEAPEATVPKDPAGQYSSLYQDQSYRIRDKSAKLNLKITTARIESFDSRLAAPPPCTAAPGTESVFDDCNGRMIAFVYVSVSAYNQRFSRQFTGYLMLQGWRDHWIPVRQAEPEVSFGGTPVVPLWTEADVDFDADVGANGGRQAHLGLRRSLTVPIDLDTGSPDFKKDEEFTLHFEVVTLTYNGRPGGPDSPGYLGAFYRDPTIEGGNARIFTEGLEATDTPAPLPPRSDAPAECQAKPNAGTLQFASPSYSVLEGSGSAGLDVMVLRTGSRTGEVSATLATSDGTATAPTDYLPLQTTVTFPDGDGSPRFVHIPLVYSTAAEPDKSFTVTLSAPTGCAALAQKTTAVTILDDTRPVPLPRIFSIGGTVTGLTGTGLTLRTDAFDQVQPSANGAFTFPVLQSDGTPYTVSVATQPGNPVQTCTVTNGSGNITGANVTNVLVTCGTPPPPSGVDPSFGSQGKLFTTAPGDVLAQQPDGKLLALGGLTLTRYSADGAPDAGFGTAGRVDLVTGGLPTDKLTAMAVQPDGKIVLVGKFNNLSPPSADWLVMRLNPDGSLDNGFGTGGIVKTAFDRHFDTATAVMLQPDGKIVVTGQAQIDKIINVGTVPIQTIDQDFAVARYLADGSLDASFGTGGKTSLDAGGTDYANGAALQADGAIIAVGRTTVANGSGNPDMSLVRFTSTGMPDLSFGDHGTERIDVATGVVPSTFNSGLTDEALDVAVRSDGKIFVAGYSLTLGPISASLPAVFRLSASGAIERNVGPVAATIDRVNGIALQGDKLVIAGTGGGDFGIARFAADGSPDTTFGANGALTVDFFGGDDAALDVLVQAGGGIVVSGSARNGTTRGTGLVRVN